jgi:hypothetical protein
VWAELPRRIEIPYRWGQVEGSVRVEVGVNADPPAFGCEEIARDFPYLRATIDSARIGYQHLGSWLQLMGDGRGNFKVDQYPPTADVANPFDFSGYSPDFFDCPHTDGLEDWDFLAHTFYCGFGGRLLEFRREVCAILGFSWGFTKRGAEIEIFGPAPLSPEDWNGHRPFLGRKYPGWKFAPGFVQDPLQP